MNNFNNKYLCISVIVPIFNTDKYLTKCICSIVNQTYKNLDIILIDDGSTDTSGEICDRYAKIDNRIRVIHKENAGLVAARKTGVAIAKGDYITFVDSDDFIELDAYELIINTLINDNIDIIAFGLVEDYGDYLIKKENHFESGQYNKGDLINRIYPRMLSYGDFFEFGILPNLVSKFFRHEFIINAKIRVSNNVSVGEDADATYQLLLQAETMQIMDIATYHYCKRTDSMMCKLLDTKALLSLENDLYESFKTSGYSQLLMAQLNQYITFVSLLKNPRTIIKDSFGLTMNRIALYGAGGFGQAIQAAYSKNIKLWVDKDYLRYVPTSLKVESVEKLKEMDYLYDIVFIAILNINVCKAIKTELIDAGINKSILYYGERI